MKQAALPLRRAIRHEWADALADDPAIPPTLKGVAAKLRRHMNGEGVCRLHVATIADAMGRSHRSIVRYLRALEAAGWIEVRQGRGRGHASTYAARWPAAAPTRGVIKLDPGAERQAAAWSEVRLAAAAGDPSPSFTDPATAPAVVAIGGWERILALNPAQRAGAVLAFEAAFAAAIEPSATTA